MSLGIKGSSGCSQMIGAGFEDSIRLLHLKFKDRKIPHTIVYHILWNSKSGNHCQEAAVAQKAEGQTSFPAQPYAHNGDQPSPARYRKIQ